VQKSRSLVGRFRRDVYHALAVPERDAALGLPVAASRACAHAGEATMPTKLSATGRLDARAVQRIGLSAAAIAAAMLFALAPAHAGDRSRDSGDRWRETCVWSWGLYSCVEQWGPTGGIAKVIPVPGPRDEQEAAATTERDRRWAARCRPVSHVDAYGVRRLRYAAPGCEFGRLDD
jgi:hypothetical protein